MTNSGSWWPRQSNLSGPLLIFRSNPPVQMFRFSPMNYGAIKFELTPYKASNVADGGSGELAIDADSQESIAMSGYVKVKKLTSGG